jgi:hypothetical protein
MVVSRRLVVEEFGAWQYMNLIFAYFMIPTGFTNMWITRHVARGDKVATTGFLFNFLLAIPVTMLFAAVSAPASQAAGISPTLFLLILPQIFLVYSLAVFESVSSGIKPHILGYGSIFFEFVKICTGLVLVLSMKLGLVGAIVSVEIAYALQDLFMLAILRKEFNKVFYKEIARKWLMLAWIPLFSSLAIQMQQFDSLLTTIITGSTAPIAMLKAAQVFSTIISFTTYSASALYPRMLAREERGDVETSIRLIAFLAIPIMFGALVLAEPLLAVLRIEYVEAAMALRISVILTTIMSITNVADTIILATEKIDVSVNVSFRIYLKSRLALLPILSFLYDLVYLPVVFFMVSYLSTINSTYATIAASIVFASLIITIPQVAYKWRLASKLISFKFPSRSIASYTIAAGVMAIAIISLNPSEAISTEIIKVIYGLFPKIAIGVVIYFALSFVLDKEPRIIVKGFLREIGLSRLSVLLRSYLKQTKINFIWL